MITDTLTHEGINHGDIVAATFEQRPYGRFVVTGPAVRTTDGEVVAVGGWFLTIKGVAAERLRNVIVLAPAGTHHLPVAATISSWGTDSLEK